MLRLTNLFLLGLAASSNITTIPDDVKSSVLPDFLTLNDTLNIRLTNKAFHDATIQIFYQRTYDQLS